MIPIRRLCWPGSSCIIKDENFTRGENYVWIRYCRSGGAVFFRVYRKWKNRGKDVLLINTVMYLYLSMVLAVTLMPVISSLPFIFNHAYVPMNLVPFTDVALSRETLSGR